MFDSIKNKFKLKSTNNEETENKEKKKKIENLIFLIFVLIVTAIIINTVWSDKSEESKEESGKVLAKIGANKVIYPEEYMGRRVAQLAMEPNLVEHLRFSSDFLLLEVKAPSIFWGKSIIELDIRKKYNSNVVGIKKEDQSFNPNPLATTVIEKGDVLLVITDNKTADFFENMK